MSKNKFNELDNAFDELIKEEKLNISSIEDLMLENIESYKRELRLHIETLLKNKVDEKELTTKKNRNGKKKDIN